MARADYEYSITQCDVPTERRGALESFRAKRKQWVTWLDNDEHHAIWTTLSSMVWNDVSFRVLAQMALDDNESSLRNSLVAEHVINGQVATQVLAIRRLMDNGRGNISLLRLLIELRGDFDLFTRENYVCFDGLPYNYEKVMQIELAAAGSGPFWAARTGPGAWAASSMAHEQFDRLSGVAAEKRSRVDRLPASLLDTIEGWLDNSGAGEIEKWSHAFLAHAGSVQRREEIANAALTNDKISAAIKALARVTEAISAEILFSSGRLNGLMATAQFNQFENLDKPITNTGRLINAQQMWDRLSAERDAFAEGLTEELLKATP
jgi:hypothetical protein